MPNQTPVSEPTWEIAQLFPDQGHWSEEEYLALTTNHLVEYANGRLEFLPMPTQSHQFLVLYLYHALFTFLAQNPVGTVLLAPLRVRLWAGKHREPDVVFMLAVHEERRGEQYWDGADLVMEVISPDDRRRDLVTKRHEYAQAGIPEYWVVDPQAQQITVLALAGKRYAEHGVFGLGETAVSRLLPGFAVEITAVFAAANR